MHYKIPMKSLAFASHAMAKKDLRYYLNGLQVRGDAVAATDGRVMLRRRDSDQVAPEPLLVPRYAVEWALKAGKGCAFVEMVRANTGQVTARVTDQTFGFVECDAIFPDCDAIIPHGVLSHDPASFAGEYLTRLAKAAKGLSRYASVRIEMAGSKAARVTFPADTGCIGVLMPSSPA